MNALELVASHIADSLNIAYEEVRQVTDYTKDRQFGDVECRIAFKMAKKLNKNPADTAFDISARIPKAWFISHIDVKGPYINIFLSDEFYKKVIEEKSVFVKKNRVVLIESPAVNPNKPWHIGHLRNALLGDAMANILEYYGYEVQRLDYIDDLGLQIAQSYWYYKKFDGQSNEKFDHFIGKQYVEAARLYPQFEHEVRETLKKMEEGLEDVKSFAKRVVEAQYKTSFDFLIFKDALTFESDIVKSIFKQGIELLKEKEAIVYEEEGKNKGCWVVKLGDVFKEMKEPDKVLIRSDGTATYTGKDVIFQLWKFGRIKGIKFEPFIEQKDGRTLYISSLKGREMFGNADVVINVIGAEQTYPQRVIKEVLKKMGYLDEAKNSIHLAYAKVRLKDASFSGRKGTWIGYTADELLQEGIKRVLNKMESKDVELAKKIALAAIKFSILRVSPLKEVVFDWDKALAIEGDSGPYLLYSYVRASSILRKALNPVDEEEVPFSDVEKELLLLISKFNEFVEKAVTSFDPSILADYLLDLAKAFHSFYSKERVIGSVDEAKKVSIVRKFAETMERGLSLLGIEVVDKM